MATTMCTGNLRSATEILCRYVETKDRRELQSGLEYIGIIVIFIIGAAIGAILSDIIGVRTVAFSCIGLCTVFLLMLINNQ